MKPRESRTVLTRAAELPVGSKRFNACRVEDQSWGPEHARMAMESGMMTDLTAHPMLEVPPNESRLSCGRNARWRKAVERQKQRLAGEATQFFSRERPTASSAC